jgi:hypothetical protein
MFSIGSPNKVPMVIALFSIVAFALLPVCPSPSPGATGSGCHSEAGSEMPDMPDQQQQPCCWAVSHHQPGIPSAGPTVSLVAIATLVRTGESASPQSFLIPELNNLGKGFSSPFKTILRV